MSDDNEIEANVGEEVEIDVEEAKEAAAEDAGYGVIGELSVYDSPVIQIQTWLHISPTIRRGRDTSFRMSLRLNTKKLKMVITPAHIKSYLFRLLLPVKKELSLFPTIKLVTSSNQTPISYTSIELSLDILKMRSQDPCQNLKDNY